MYNRVLEENKVREYLNKRIAEEVATQLGPVVSSIRAEIKKKQQQQTPPELPQELHEIKHKVSTTPIEAFTAVCNRLFYKLNLGIDLVSEKGKFGIPTPELKLGTLWKMVSNGRKLQPVFGSNVKFVEIGYIGNTLAEIWLHCMQADQRYLARQKHGWDEQPFYVTMESQRNATLVQIYDQRKQYFSAEFTHKQRYVAILGAMAQYYGLISVNEIGLLQEHDFGNSALAENKVLVGEKEE